MDSFEMEFLFFPICIVLIEGGKVRKGEVLL